MTMSSSTNETQNSLQICNECGNQIELLLTSRTQKIQIVNFGNVENAKN